MLHILYVIQYYNQSIAYGVRELYQTYHQYSVDSQYNNESAHSYAVGATPSSREAANESREIRPILITYLELHFYFGSGLY